MLGVIKDGLFVFYEYGEAIIAFLVTLFGIGYYLTGFVVDRGTDVKIKVLASFGFGCIFLSLIAFVLIIMSYLWGFPLRVGSLAILISAIIILVGGLWSGEFKSIFTPGSFLVILALFFLLLTRLAFLKHILLPPYSDSPIHYQIVSNFLHPAEDSTSKISLQTIFSNYYHFGFHSLVAWLVSITAFGPDKMIALIGQLSLLIAPVSIMFLFFSLTNSSLGTLFAGLLAAVGWLMPSYAVNWGKYPALLSIAILPVVALLPLLLLNNKFKKTRILVFGLILLIGITFIHTRIVICLFFAYIGFYIVNKLEINEEFGFFQSVRYTLLFVLFLWPLSRLLIDFYKNIPVLVALLVLIPFAFQSYPTVSIGIMIFLSGLSMAALLPNLFDVGGYTLLDRQFLTIILHVPLSLIGGLGFVGIIRQFRKNVVLKNVVVLTLVTCVFANVTPGVFYPDRCCIYFNENDKLAFQWILENSSTHTLYYISTIKNDSQAFGSDAGIWIFPLIQVATNKLPFNIYWSSVNVFNTICPSRANDAYIYVGGKEFSFDDAQLSRVEWASPVFRTGEVAIYKISNCVANVKTE